MKNLIILLLLTFSILTFAQDKPTSENESETLIIEVYFDVRCMSPIEWSSTLIIARRDGVTVNSVIEKMVQDYNNGPLRDYRPETIEYMLTIISTVFAADAVDTPDEIISVLREVESICIAFLDEAQEQPEEEAIST